MRHPVHQFIALTVLVAVVGGCQSPFDTPDTPDQALRRTVRAAIDRELEHDPAAAIGPQRTRREPTTLDADILERQPELDALTPALDDPAPPTGADLGQDLLGRPQSAITLTLASTVQTAVENNLQVRIAAIEPGITRAQRIAAEAAFDAVFFGSANHTKTDQPAAIPVITSDVFGTVPLGTPFRSTENTRFETGIRKPLRTGGEARISTDLTRARNTDPNSTLIPDPAYTAALRLGLTQPLLRGAGTDVNTATIRIAENAERVAIQSLRTELLTLAADVESAYWNLVLAWHDLAIRQWLVEVGDEVRDRFDRRRDLDALPAQLADAIATVESRQADVIRARLAVRQASDRLKLLLNDDDLSIGSEVVLQPADTMSGQPIEFNLREALLTAIEYRPEVQQSLLSIDDAKIRERVADNARLPLLNLDAEIAYFGLDDVPGDAYDNALTNEFIDYIVGLVFEYPIGNRAADAEFRAARLRRSASVLQFRSAVQQVVFEVKSALREVVANYELIEATRASRIAAAENVRTLDVQETLRGLTPELLNLKFQRQDRLAAARRAELQAMVNFDTALANLYRAMGIGLQMNDIAIELDGQEN